MAEFGAATFILVAGAAQPAGIWHRVVPLLQQAGHRVIAVDFARHGR